MATGINETQIPDQVSKPGYLLADSKPEQLSEPSVDSQVPEPQADSKPQRISEHVDLHPQEVSGPELDSESRIYSILYQQLYNRILLGLTLLLIKLYISHSKHGWRC